MDGNLTSVLAFYILGFVETGPYSAAQAGLNSQFSFCLSARATHSRLKKPKNLNQTEIEGNFLNLIFVMKKREERKPQTPHQTLYFQVNCQELSLEISDEIRRPAVTTAVTLS